MITSNAGKPRGILYAARNKDRFRLSRRLPSEDLRFFIEHFWSVQWNVPQPYTQENLPHPSIHIVVEKGDSGIVGVVSGKFTRILQGEGQVFGIKFKPGAFYPFAKFPLSRITDKIIPLEEVFGSNGAVYKNNIVSLENETEKVKCAEEFVREHLPAQDKNVLIINRIVDQVMNDRTIVKVEEISKLFDITTRTLQRLFSQYVGISPKWVIQRYRLLEAVEQMNEGNAIGWVKLALDIGYFDQAHFIKDFKNLVGKSPEEYKRNTAEKSREKQK